jgi:hypothetical protein
LVAAREELDWHNRSSIELSYLTMYQRRAIAERSIPWSATNLLLASSFRFRLSSGRLRTNYGVCNESL